MRILHIEKFYEGVGGTGTYLELVTGLQRARGHEVFRFGCVGPGGPPEMPRFRDFAARRNPLDLARMIHNVEAADKLDALLRRRPADVAHLHNIYHHLTPSILPVLARRGVGIVMRAADYRLACPTKHFLRPDGPCTRCLGNRFFHAASPRCAGLAGAALAVESYVQRFFRRYFRLVSFFLCPTRFMAGILRRAGAPAGKIVVLPNLVRPFRLPPADPNGRDLLFAGRLSAEKAPGLMLDLAEQVGDARVTLAGDGPLREALQADIARRGLRNVTLAGPLAPKQLEGYYAQAAAVVLTSACYENSPMSMLEAMAAGRCVIVPDHPPLREWVRDGRTGRLFSPGDARSLERVAREVLADPAGRARMADAAGKLVRRRHDAGAILDELDRLYEDAIRRCGLR